MSCRRDPPAELLMQGQRQCWEACFIVGFTFGKLPTPPLLAVQVTTSSSTWARSRKEAARRPGDEAPWVVGFALPVPKAGEARRPCLLYRPR